MNLKPHHASVRWTKKQDNKFSKSGHREERIRTRVRIRTRIRIRTRFRITVRIRTRIRVSIRVRISVKILDYGLLLNNVSSFPLEILTFLWSVIKENLTNN